VDADVIEQLLIRWWRKVRKLWNKMPTIYRLPWKCMSASRKKYCTTFSLNMIYPLN